MYLLFWLKIEYEAVNQSELEIIVFLLPDRTDLAVLHILKVSSMQYKNY
jgi:hypothetical protein